MYRVQNRAGRLVEIEIDLRRAKVFPPQVVDAYVATMSDEPRLEQTATFLPTSAVLALQIGRMIREAGHPGRRAFEDAPPPPAR